jgi:membrane protease YdiL (CAAX protease family)
MPAALSGNTRSGGGSIGVLLTVLGATFVLNGLVAPTVEEMYFRGHILPRMPVIGWMAAVTNAALFSIQHFWQPDLYLLVFVLQLVSITVLMKLRDLRLPIILHCLVNITGSVIALVAIMGR